MDKDEDAVLEVHRALELNTPRRNRAEAKQQRRAMGAFGLQQPGRR